MTQKFTPPPGNGTWRGCPLNGGTPTTTAITCSPTSSASTTTSVTALCASPVTNRGGPAICCSRCDIYCWLLRLNGESRCTVCTPNKIARVLTPKNRLTHELCAANSPARQAKISCCFLHSPGGVGVASFSGTR